jgi:serine/threonine protein kinase
VQSDGIDPVDLVETLEKHLIERERGDADPVKKQTIQKKVDDLAHKLMGKARKSAGDDVAGSILIKPIASGNFATVWLSRNASTGETTAVKLFHAEKLSQGLMLWRFRRSIRAMRLLTQHRDTPRSVVRIREVSTDTLAFAMDYLAGGDLSDIDRRGWSLQQKIDVMLEICRAVAFAHRVGVIHRDIKPSNVIIDDRGGPVLTDFDIADIHFVTKLSVASGGLGTPVFAAPEQLEEADSATERSDIYSLGRLLYFLLLERSPGFQIEEDPALENLRRFPSALVAIVRRATQYRPERRYAGVNEMISELAQYQSRRARAMAQLYLAGRWTKRNAYALMILSLIIGGLLAFVVYYQEQALLSKQRAEAEKKYADEKRIMAENVKQLASRVDGLGQQKEDLFYEINRIVANKNIVTEQLKKADLTEQQRAELEIELSRWVADEGKTRRKLIQLNSEMATTRKQLETIMTTHQIARPGLQSPSPATSVAVDNLQPMPSPTIAPAATATASPVDPLVPMSDDRDFRPSWQ